MGGFALNPQGAPVIAADIPGVVWESWKGGKLTEPLRMSCCGADAVPKTSPNGLHFFAHLNDECATAPETIWHRQAKALVQDAMRRLSAECNEEVFDGEARSWKADLLVRHDGRRIAIEIQHSYQHLRDFLRRQERYRQSGVECVWLLPHNRYLTLAKATSRLRLKEEFGGRWPPAGTIGGPCLAGLPVAMLPEPDARVILGASLFRVELDAWCQALLDGQFLWSEGTWLIGTGMDAPGSGILRTG